ncbi:hypothetical protein [Vulcanisaeta thermophila]|uniref:hypothetical protein n=1 Tax=Vulcanisaeta thermophila TaxID=867917 RepID=UPI000852B806|nr:hypothetical protein [Vulcanisaeta thermophila]
MSFEVTYALIVSIVVFVLAIGLAVFLNSRYYRMIVNSMTKAREPQATVSGDLEVLKCPKCGYSTTIPFRVGDYVGKVVNETCPNDGSRLVVYAIYSSRPTQP